MAEETYDDLRTKNIAERNAVFAEFFQDLKKQTREVKSLRGKIQNTDNLENEPPKKRRITISGAIGYRSRHGVQQPRTYNTRSRTKSSGGGDLKVLEDDEDDETLTEPTGNRPKLRVLFPWAKPFQRSIDLMKMGVCDVDQENEEWNDDDDDDDDELYDYVSQRKVYTVAKAPYDPDNIPSVDEITEEMLNNIAEKSTLKNYCKSNGSSCHQCRQKTLDTKTVCRSGECIGIRGQFCGPCLRGRYGESAYDALKDPDWACPPCRGLCNCSICRTKSGLRPTGILAPVAQEEGYSSVMDYLHATEIDDT